jgi:hypothetical protein
MKNYTTIKEILLVETAIVNAKTDYTVKTLYENKISGKIDKHSYDEIIDFLISQNFMFIEKSHHYIIWTYNPLVVSFILKNVGKKGLEI